uniref:Uncharacterized protein n=1 Tax=Monodelphis domestica TaxID=13616 RepID=A0A5F8H2U7_MONDO
MEAVGVKLQVFLQKAESDLNYIQYKQEFEVKKRFPDISRRNQYYLSNSIITTNLGISFYPHQTMGLIYCDT